MIVLPQHEKTNCRLCQTEILRNEGQPIGVLADKEGTLFIAHQACSNKYAQKEKILQMLRAQRRGSDGKTA